MFDKAAADEVARVRCLVVALDDAIANGREPREESIYCIHDGLNVDKKGLRQVIIETDKQQETFRQPPPSSQSDEGHVSRKG